MTVSESSGVGVQTVTAPRLPRVNLMPPEIAEAARFRRFQLAMGATLAGVVAIAGLIYMHEKSGVAAAQADLATEQTQTTALQSQLAQLQSVSATYAEVQAKQGLLAMATAGEIRWSYYLTDLGIKMPDNVWLTNLTASQTGGTSTTTTSSTLTPTTSTTGAPVIGNITFSGVAFKHDDVAAWLDVLGKEPGFVDPYFTTSTRSQIGPRPVVNFDSSTNVSSDATSYTNPAGS
jgi:Tfp pilus assembly protein PilN